VPADLVDLRSDTVTRPGEAMRRAMADAEVGDDGFGDDPTVHRLQEAFAARVGKEAALFVPSGIMANQIALRLLGRPGTAVVAGRHQHVVTYERGGAGLNAAVQFHLVDDDDGTLDVAAVRWAVEAAEHHYPEVSAVFVENTHMPSGGTCWPLDRLEEVAAVGPAVHLDGARLFNAEVASGVPAADYAAPATTVMCCLSKGLGAPIGSLIAGPADLVDAAHDERKRLGGAMRQVGFLAAAGLYALEHNVERLAEDHARARRLAEAVAERWPECGLDPEGVTTNAVIWRHPDPAALVVHLHDAGVLAGTIAPGVLRMMTHLDVDDDGVERAAKALASAP
jgi:threonine aldolase